MPLEFLFSAVLLLMWAWRETECPTLSSSLFYIVENLKGYLGLTSNLWLLLGSPNFPNCILMIGINDSVK